MVNAWGLIDGSAGMHQPRGTSTPFLSARLPWPYTSESGCFGQRAGTAADLGRPRPATTTHCAYRWVILLPNITPSCRTQAVLSWYQQHDDKRPCKTSNFSLQTSLVTLNVQFAKPISHGIKQASRSLVGTTSSAIKGVACESSAVFVKEKGWCSGPKMLQRMTEHTTHGMKTGDFITGVLHALRVHDFFLDHSPKHHRNFGYLRSKKGVPGRSQAPLLTDVSCRSFPRACPRRLGAC